jgi:hypothetical protein
VLRLVTLASLIFCVALAGAADYPRPEQSALAHAFETASSDWILKSDTTPFRKLSAPPGGYWDLRPWKKLSIAASLAQRNLKSLRLRWAFISRVGGVYCAAKATLITPDLATLAVDLQPAASDLIPVGHTRPWDELAASEIERIELRAECLFGPKDQEFAVALSAIQFELTEEAPAQAVLLDAVIHTAPAAYNAKAVVTFRIDPLPRDPYAPDGAGDVRVSLPSGEEVLAFLDQHYTLASDGSAERSSPEGRPVWRAYLPDLPATGKLRVRNGTSQWSIPVSIFNPATPPEESPRASRERISWPLEAPLPDRTAFSCAPTGFELTKSGDWNALETKTESSPAKAWTPIPFWSSAWGGYHGNTLPNDARAQVLDSQLTAAAAEGTRQPLSIFSGETLERTGVFNWAAHPLNVDLKASGELFRSEAGFDFSRRVARYCIARWGASKAVSELCMTSTLATPGVSAFHGRFGKALNAWSASIGLPLISLHPLAREPQLVSNLSYILNQDDVNSYGWAPIAACNATGEKLLSEGVDNGKCYELRSNDAASTHLGMINTYNVIRQNFNKDPIDNFGSADTVTFDVWIPANAPADLRVGVHLRDRDSLWYETVLPGMLRPGDWNTCALDISEANANKLTALNHTKSWTAYSRQRIREFGFHLYSIHPNWSPMTGIGPLPLVARFANIHAVALSPEAKNVPRITAYAPQPAQDDVFATSAVYVGGLWQQHVRISKTFKNPFDPCECDLTAVITAPSGKVVRVPCFFDELCERKEQEPGGAEILSPVGAEFFTARFRATEPGPHRVQYELREGGKYESDNSNPIYEKLHFVPGPVTATLELQQPGFVVNPGTAPDAKPFHGFLRAAANKRNLEFQDGTFFYPVGPNLRSPADWLFPYNDTKKWTDAFADKVAARQTYQYDDYFKAFEDAHMTWARIWMCAYWCALEWRRDWPGYQGMKHYNLLNAWRLDHVLADAERRGIMISLCLTNHGQYSAQVDAEWKYNPYSAVYGGPLKSAADFYSNREAKIGHLDRLRYTVARYGHSPAIMTWSLFSEVEWTAAYKPALHWNDTPDDPVPVIDAWHADMAKFLKSIDPNQHMVATHFSHPWRGFGTLAVPDLDIASSNAYSSMMELGIGEMDAAAALAAYWNGNGRWFKGFKIYGKPALVEEFGRHWDGATALKDYGVRQSREDLDADLHAGIWGSLVQPLAGSTGYWWWMHLHFDNRYNHYKAFTAYISGEDFRAEKGESQLEPAFRQIASENDALLGRAMKSDRRMYAWIYHRQMPLNRPLKVIEGGKLRVGGLRPGTYTLEFWNTYTGEKTETRELEATSSDQKPATVEILLPPVDHDLALKLKMKS